MIQTDSVGQRLCFFCSSFFGHLFFFAEVRAEGNGEGEGRFIHKIVSTACIIPNGNLMAVKVSLDNLCACVCHGVYSNGISVQQQQRNCSSLCAYNLYSRFVFKYYYLLLFFWLLFSKPHFIYKIVYRLSMVHQKVIRFVTIPDFILYFSNLRLISLLIQRFYGFRNTLSYQSTMLLNLD